MPGNISLVNNVSMTNSTYDTCLFNAHRQLKGLSFFDLDQEEKIDDIQKNLECALEKYGEKVEKYPKEDALSFMDRTINLYNTLSKFFSSNAVDTSNQKYEVINTRKQEYQIIYTRNFDRS